MPTIAAFPDELVVLLARSMTALSIQRFRATSRHNAAAGAEAARLEAPQRHPRFRLGVGQSGWAMPPRGVGAHLVALEATIEMQTAARIAMASVSTSHALVIGKGGRAFGCGIGNQKLQLGKAYWQLPGGPALPPDEPIDDLHEIAKTFERCGPVIEVASGRGYSAVLTSRGCVYTWGWCKSGRLGLGVVGRVAYHTPHRVWFPKKTRIKRIATSSSSTYMVEASRGRIFVCGRNDAGQLGLGDTQDRTKPTLIRGELLEGVVHVAARFKHVLAVTEEGSLYAWGLNHHGQLGLGGNQQRHLPTQSAFFAATPATGRIMSASVSKRHSIVLDEHGMAYVFGASYATQPSAGPEGKSAVVKVWLPHPGRADPDGPDPTEASAYRARIVSVAAGDYVSAFVSYSGALWFCGRADCFPKAAGLRFQPTRVEVDARGGVLKWRSVAAGGGAIFAVTRGGTLFSGGAGITGRNAAFAASFAPTAFNLMPHGAGGAAGASSEDESSEESSEESEEDEGGVGGGAARPVC